MRRAAKHWPDRAYESLPVSFSNYDVYEDAARSRGAESFIVGTDDRVRVMDTLGIPFRFICCLEFTFRHPRTGVEIYWRGSGTLISDQHVLTAAHNVLTDVSRDDPTFPINYVSPRQMLVAPARNDRDFPGNSSEVLTTHISPLWQANADRQRALGNTTHMPGPQQADFALLRLRVPLGAREPLGPVGMQLPPPLLGYWGDRRFGGNTRIRAYDSASWQRLIGQTLNLSGYAADKCRHWPMIGSATEAQMQTNRCRTAIPGLEPFIDWGSTQWRSSGTLINPPQAPGLITYDLDSMAGHSGGPIWLNSGGARNLVAIHTLGFNATTNAGVPITEPLLRQLRQWMRDDRVEPTF